MSTSQKLTGKTTKTNQGRFSASSPGGTSGEKHVAAHTDDPGQASVTPSPTCLVQNNRNPVCPRRSSYGLVCSRGGGPPDPARSPPVARPSLPAALPASASLLCRLVGGSGELAAAATAVLAAGSAAASAVASAAAASAAAASAATASAAAAPLLPSLPPQAVASAGTAAEAGASLVAAVAAAVAAAAAAAAFLAFSSA